MYKWKLYKYFTLIILKLLIYLFIYKNKLKMFSKIIQYLKKTNFREILIISIIILSLFLWHKCSESDKNTAAKVKSEQNAAYYKDSLLLEKNKSGELDYYRATLTGSLADIKKSNKALYDQVQKQNGNVIYISSLLGSLRDSINILSSKNNKNSSAHSGTLYDGSKYISFTDDTIYSPGNERHIEGNVDFKNIKDSIDENSISVALKTKQLFSLNTGLVQDDSTKLLRIFVDPNYPGLTISHIDGALIDPQKSALIQSYFKPQRWSFGPQVGVGITSGLKPAIFVGIGVQYSLQFKDLKNIFK